MIEQTALATLLHERLTEWDRARKGQEAKLLECYQDVMRIARDDDTAGTGTAKTRKTKSLFIGSTRNKVRAAKAKINDALFGNGKMPFDTEPTNEKLAPFADVMEDILTKQMEQMHFKKLIKGGVNTLAKYGTGFIFGPFVRQEKHTETTMVDGILQESTHEYDCPYFELGNTLDVFPDPEAREIEKGLGTFWVTMMSPHSIKELKGRPGYKNIDQALIVTTDRADQTGSEKAQSLRANLEYWSKDGQIKFARFFGKIPKRSLSVWNESSDVHDTTKETEDSGDVIDAIVIMAGGTIIKVDETPYQADYCPVLRCAYEDEEHEMWGVGVAENNGPHQKVTNAAFRLFMEGKGMALLGTATVDRSKFLPSEDFKKFPGKVYQTKPGLSAEERKEAIIFHNEPDITGGWLDVIKVSEGMSDDDTGVNKYTQGDDSRNLNKTASGISMIMSAGSLPFKDVISHVDESWIVKIVEALITWNLKYLEPETVAKIHGQKKAGIWAQIKQFGKSSFMTWQATGTSSFMQKEVLVGKIRAFSEFALGNPVTGPLIDARELLEQTWTAMEVGKESPVLKEQGQEPIPPQIKAEMDKMHEEGQALHQAFTQAQAQIQQLEQEKKARLDETQMKLQADARKAEMTEHFNQLREQMKADLAMALKERDVEIADRRNLADIIKTGMQPPPIVAEEVQPDA